MRQEYGIHPGLLVLVPMVLCVGLAAGMGSDDGEVCYIGDRVPNCPVNCTRTCPCPFISNCFEFGYEEIVVLDDVVLNEQLLIDSTVTIKGESENGGTVNITCNSQVKSCIEVQRGGADVQATLDNINISGGGASDQPLVSVGAGCSLHLHNVSATISGKAPSVVKCRGGAFTATSSSFSSSTWTARSVITLEDASAEISDCMFANATVEEAVVLSSGSDLIIRRSAFISNVIGTLARSAFGAVALRGNRDSEAVAVSAFISDTLFDSNSARTRSDTHVSIADNGSSVSVFDDAALHNVTIARCEFKFKPVTEGYTDYGSAVYAVASSPAHPTSVYVLDSIFRESTSYTARGTSIYAYKSVSLYVIGCLFESQTGERGGALYGATLNANDYVVKNCTFRGCHARFDGGAIYAANLAMSDTTIVNCSCSSLGGGVFAGTIDGGVIDIRTSRFEGNYASLRGAGLNVESPVASPVTVTDTVFVRNIAGMDGGGANFINMDQVVVRRCTFDSNIARTGSGGSASFFCASRKFFQPTGMLALVENCTFVNGSAGRNGGGVVSGSDVLERPQTSVKMLLRGCAFTNNSAAESGGGVALSGPSFVHDCHFSGNSVSFPGFGGGFAHQLGLLMLENSTFQGNRGRNGGALFLASEKGTMVRDIIAIDNTGVGLGGVVMTGVQSVVLMRRMILLLNNAKSGGAVLAAGNSISWLEDSFLLGNSATEYGGALYGADSSFLETRNTVFLTNSAVTAGGVAYIGDDAHAHFFENQFMLNTASTGACVFSSVFSSSVMQQSVLFRNFASNRGGAYVAAGQSEAYITSSLFLANEAGSGGGVAVQDTGTMVISSSNFTENLSTWSGGGLFCSENSRLNATDCKFERNEALEGNGGGAVMLDSAEVVLAKCSFSGNQAYSGGAVQISTMGAFSAASCLFASNEAQVDGGAVILERSSVGTFVNSSFTLNQADRSGGSLMLKDQSTMIGHAVDISDSQSGSLGGAIYSSHRVVLNLFSTNIRNASATHGGALYLSDALTGEFENVRVERCRASREGGALHVSRCSALTMRNLTITSSHASRGGAVYIRQCTTMDAVQLQCAHCSFENNSAVLTGGALEISPLQYIELDDKPTSNTKRALAEAPSLLTRDAQAGNATAEYNFVNASFSRNRAKEGAAVSYNGQFTRLTFGPTVSFDANEAEEWGGCVALSEPQLLDEPWMWGAAFTRNVATFGGGVASIDAYDRDGVHFCQDCEAHDNEAGYQTTWGLASKRAEATLLGCHPTTSLLDPEMQIEIFLKDDFGNVVAGPFLRSENYTVSIKVSNCGGYAAVKAMPEEGVTTFGGWSLKGKYEENCVIAASISSTVTGLVTEQLYCSTSLGACPSGYELVEHSSYDECQEETEPLISLNEFLLIIIGILIAAILVIALVFVVRRVILWRRVQRMKAISIPDFGGSKPSPTLEDILRDPDITNIAWGDISLGDKIGSGADGVVHRAVWHRAGEAIPVAVKQLYVEGQLESLKAFLCEIKIASTLQHPNLMSILGVSHIGNTELCLISELAERGSLASVLSAKQGNLPLSLRYHLAIGAAKGIEFLHSCRIIHRDVKPANILVTEDWTAKMADFGNSTIRPERTVQMTTVGTPMYMAPEVLRKSKYSEMADVYSFGITLCELFSGRTPFPEVTSMMELVQMILRGDRPSLEGFSAELRALIQDCWMDNPKLRPGMSEVLARLRRLRSADPAVEERLGSFRNSGTGISSASDSEFPAPAISFATSDVEVQELADLSSGRKL